MYYDDEKYSEHIEQIEKSLYQMLYNELPPEQKRLIMRVLNLLLRQAEQGVILDKSAFGILECFFLEKYPGKKE